MTSFSVSGADLVSAATLAAQIAPSRSSTPELGAVVIEGAADRVMFSVYDQVTAGSATVVGEVTEPGRLLVSARLLALIATMVAREARVHVNDKGDMASVVAGRSRWELPLLDARYYPQLPQPGPAVGRVDAAQFASALGRALATVGDPNAPPMFGGACLAGDLATFTVAATDRWRLSVTEIDWEPAANTTELPDTIVPGPVLERMAFAARQETGSTVALRLNERGASLTGQNSWVHGPLIDCPDPTVWRRISLADEDATTTAVVDTEELKQVVARASVLLDPKDALIVKVSNDVGGHEIRLGMLDGKRGQVDHGCPAEVTGGERVIGVDGDYLRKGINTLASPTTKICFFAGRKRGFFLLVPLDEDGKPIPGFRHVIMAKRALDAAAVA